MKVSYVTMQFSAASETFARSDVKSLEKLGVDVFVYSLKGRDEELKNHQNISGSRLISSAVNYILELIKSAVNILSNPILFIQLVSWMIKNEWNQPKQLLALFYLVPRAFNVFSSIKKSSPDIVHLFWGHYPSIVGYLIFKSRLSTKLSMFLGAYDLEMELSCSLDLAKKLKHVFTHANCNKNRILELCDNQCDVTIIHRGVDIRFLDSFSNDQKDPNLWVTGGRLIRDKRFDKVLVIFKEHFEKNPKARLLIAGNGPEEEELKKMSVKLGMSESVCFSGFLPQSELFKILSTSSVFLFLSEKPGERLPNIVKEAMFFENCCYVSRTPGIEELIDDKQDGIIVEEGRESSWSFNELTPDDYVSMAKNAKSKIVSNFDVNVQMQKYIEVWNRL